MHIGFSIVLLRVVNVMDQADLDHRFHQDLLKVQLACYCTTLNSSCE